MLKKIAQLHQSSASNRAAINTVVIYLQRFMAAGLSLFTTPIILNALGVEDYGIYTLTIGFVGMLSILNWSLSNSTQRFTAFALGEGNTAKLKAIFSTALAIHLLYGVLLFLTISGISFFFIQDMLNIPIGKIENAKNVLYIVGIVSFVNIVSIPFLGVLRAYENLIAISLVGILESFLKLGIAIILLYTLNDKLLLYATLLMIISCISILLYIFIINKKYKDVAVSFKYFSKELVNEMFSFLSWSLLGSLSLTSRNEGVQIIINIFFGVARNAAYGIAMQINSAMAILSQGIIASLGPQIVKSAGTKEYDKMIFLMRTMSKFATFSVSLIAIPLFFECPTILRIWLKTVPEDTINYVRLIIIFGQIMLLSAGIQNVFDAIGKVKTYNIWVSFILMLNLPITYVLFSFGLPSYSVIIVGMFLELVSLNVRLKLLKKHVNFSIPNFYFDAFFRVFLPSFFVAMLLYLLSFFIINIYLKLFFSFLITFVTYPFVIYKFSLEVRQKEIFTSMINKMLKRS